ncbi:MerR family transcriptional regulator [Nodosilinea sp. LEGE 07298]|uniref:MerR family transcriptional regulator n=1 Tax=Nodosilinea sp. LEGE 07298 TaxID=2777970 RepID=UPI001880EC3C|nr:MerR family transcriptional regulator [Nodosilinea sp. LEGE 07298]MBE9111198.1 MerR family transcriptional regulator [Nodosilinea sp. LEGE 07298]
MFRIGEFSKIAQVSGRLLRYYDEIGLLSPKFTDQQTGYRFYSAQQLPELNRILVLKELGLSLEQIAQLPDRDTSIDVIRSILSIRKAQIEQSVHEELARLRQVETRLQQIEAYGQIQEPNVVLKSVPAQQFLALREVLPDIDAVKRLVQKINHFLPSKVGQSSLGHMAVVMHSPVYNPEALDLEIGYLITGKAPESVRLSEERLLTLRELFEIETMATLVHMGLVADTHQTYGALGAWIEQHDWQIVGTGREILLQLPQPDKTEEAVFEIQFPISKISSRLGA